MLFATTSNAASARNQSASRSLAPQRQVVLDALLVHPALDGARPEVRVARDGERHAVGPEEHVELVGRDLATPQARGEVPQRPLAALGLVDREHLVGPEPHGDEERGVRRVRDPAVDLQGAL